jgi:pantoate--beta-alanine ligase
MKVFSTIREVRSWLADHRKRGKSVGFVPTMGALHRGHLALVRRSREENDMATCSIFVNPIQFNNPEDLEKYPRTVESDLELLEKTGCDMVFMPSVDEMYPEPVSHEYDFGDLGKVMEGKFRPGHFNGVAIVVKKLFDIIQPDKAYFGEKDFQQLRVIEALVRMENMPVSIVPYPIVRESDGLAMSSRNIRLSREQRAVAPEIYQTLLRANDLAGKIPVAEVKEFAIARLAYKGFRPEYFEIVDSQTLSPVNVWDGTQEVRACVAVHLGKVRLIDNMILFPNFAG